MTEGIPLWQNQRGENEIQDQRNMGGHLLSDCISRFARCRKRESVNIQTEFVPRKPNLQ